LKFGGISVWVFARRRVREECGWGSFWDSVAGGKNTPKMLKSLSGKL